MRHRGPGTVALRGATTRRHLPRGVLLLVVLGLVVSASIASADPWGSQSITTGANPDGGNHNYCFGVGFPASLELNADKGMDAVDETDANVGFKTVCKIVGSPRTDVLWLAAAPSDTFFGQAPCVKYWPGGTCDQFAVRMHKANIDASAALRSDISKGFAQTKVATHEAGHTVGLSHYPGLPGGGLNNEWDGMRSGISNLPTNPSKADFHHYNTHHTAHINAWF